MKPEDQLLVITMEECAELSQACAKILRFGMHEHSEKNLKQELGDVACMIALMLEYEWITEEELNQAIEKKAQKLKIFSDLPLP